MELPITYTQLPDAQLVELAMHIRHYLKVNVCPVCSNNTIAIHRIQNSIEIGNICHQEYRIQVTRAISVYRIFKNTINFRGEVLNAFIIFENFIDLIIKSNSISYKIEFEEIAKRYKKSNMDSRIELFKICIAKSEIESGRKTTIINEFITLVDLRNILAHCLADVSLAGIKYFEEKGKIRFITNPMKSTGGLFHGHDSKIKAIKRIENLRKDIFNVFDKTIDYEF